jgi:hypothetical protein
MSGARIVALATAALGAASKGGRTMRIRWTLGMVAGLTAAVSLSVAGLAQAKPLEKGTFHEEFTDVTADFCDVQGLTVQSDFVVDGRFMVNPRGPDGLAYYMERVKFTRVDTNLANGKFVTSKATVTDKDLKVTDNGDGTLTILVLATGNDVLYGMDGKAIARNPGQVRFELLVDHNGTPTDPADDEFLAFLGVVKESTGRSDDFCAALVTALD